MGEPTDASRQKLTSKSGVTFRAGHLDITHDLKHPLPPSSESFRALRAKVKILWQVFEKAGEALVSVDDSILKEVLAYRAAHPRSTNAQLLQERFHRVAATYEPLITKAELYCSELSDGIAALEEAATKEAETVEARATMEIDLPIFKTALATTLDIIAVAKVQLAQANAGVRQ